MQPCIIDSCSLLHSFHVKLGGESLSSFIAGHFEVILHQTVLDEMFSVLKRAYPRWRERQLVSEDMSEIRRIHAEWTAAKRSDQGLETEKQLIEAENCGSLDKGEIDCIALAKAIADKHVSYVVLLTDDYDAGESAKRVFDKYQVGTVVRSADLISFFGIRYKLAKPEIHQGLRNLISFYTNLYETTLKEVRSLLPGSEGSNVVSLLHRGDFTRAKEAVTRIGGTERSQLIALVAEIATSAAKKSVVAQALSRLRTLDGIRL